MMKLLLINCKIDSDHLRLGFEKYPAEEPLGLMSIATTIRGMVEDVRILDENIEIGDDDFLIEYLRRFRPDIIGLSATSFSQFRMEEVARLVKKVLPEAFIIAGGVITSTLHRPLLENHTVDYCVVGEGETAMCQLLHYLEGLLSEIDLVPNLYYLKGGDVQFTHSFRENLDLIPTPDRAFVDQGRYLKACIPLSSSRGCSFPCTFCSSILKEHRYRSTVDVIDEAEMLNQLYPQRFINFREDNFFFNKERVVSLCREIRHRKSRFKWRCQGRVESITNEIVKELASANCVHINLGVDVLDKNSAYRSKKQYSLKKIREAMRMIDDVGIQYSINILFGFPFSSRFDIYQTIFYSFLLNTPKINLYEYVGIPGSELYSYLKEKNAIRKLVGEVIYPLPMHMPYFEMKFYKEVMKLVSRLAYSKQNILHCLKEYLQDQTIPCS